MNENPNSFFKKAFSRKSDEKTALNWHHEKAYTRVNCYHLQAVLQSHTDTGGA